MDEQPENTGPVNRLARVIHATARIAIVSAKKFVADDCLGSASVIAYSLIVSLVPLLTVGFSLFTAFSGIGTRKRELFNQVERFLQDQGANLDIRPFIDVIDSLTSNAASIGGIGLLVLIFSATAILRTLEHSFNAIWRIRTTRGVVRQVVFYWAALTLGPVLLATGVSLAGIVRSSFTKPTLREVRLIGERLWIVGDRGTVLVADRKLAGIKPLTLKHVDLGRQDLLYADAETEDEGELQEVPDRDRLLVEVTEEMLRKASFKAIHHRGRNIWLLTEDGVILSSPDLGGKWRVTRLLMTGTSQKYAGLGLNDIVFTDDKNGFIVGKRGVLLRSVNGGTSWMRLSASTYEGVRSDVSSTDDINKIAFRNQREGIAVCNRGTFLLTQDGGNTWVKKGVVQARVDRTYADLLDISFNEVGEPWVAGGLGLVLFSNADFKNWKARAAGDNTARRAVNAGNGRLILISQADRVLYSVDAGRRWQRKELGGLSVESVYVVDGRAIAVGENLSIHVSTPVDQERISWQRRQGGGSPLLGILRVILPFALVWVMFVAIFVILPNTRVPLIPASIGAAVAGAVWVLFVVGFMFYIRYFSGGTQAIYGALAAVPLFLLVVYSSAVILLYGAELTYVLSSRIYARADATDTGLGKGSVYPGIRMLAEVFRNFELGRGPSSLVELQKFAQGDASETGRLLSILHDAGWIASPEEGRWAPLKSAKLVSLEDVVQRLERDSYEIQQTGHRDAIAAVLQQKFSAAQGARSGQFSHITMAEIAAAE